jgi:adenine-specific DNA-methyltransferase
MQKLEWNHPETQSQDIIQHNLEQLKILFPEAFTEGKIDFEVLKQLLGEELNQQEEKYGFNWHGKRAARRLALTPSTGTLRPCPEDSLDWDTTQNLMIEGDNLEVLKLLQKSYAGKVKLIYIDPPYNTGNDFIYKDDFIDNITNYLEITGLISKDGEKISSLASKKNPESSGRYHTDWLNMIYPRIKLAHSLLKRDGAIFVSIDETEQPRLRLVMDEIFGQENFITDMVWAGGRKNDSKLISVSHEYIICYVRDIGYLNETKVEWRQHKKGLDAIYKQHDRLRSEYGSNFKLMTQKMKDWFKSLPDNHPAKAHKHYSHIDSRGIFFPDNISWPGGGGPTFEVLHPLTQKSVKVPSRGWMTSDPEKMKQWIAEDRVHFGENEDAVPCIKSYLKDREYQTPYSVFYQDGRASTKRLRELMEGDCFDFPKDELILQEIISMMTSGDDLVLDFFAGSGTTGHAVMAQNSLDGANRAYALVQLPELLNPDKKEQKNAADYCDKIGKRRNIAELTKERLRRASKKIKDENPLFHGDLGFRVLKLDSSNIHAWEADRDNLPKTLEESIEHLKPDRTESDILYELLLKLGLDLCVPIENKTIVGKTVYSIGNGVLLVCLAEKISQSDAEPLTQGIIAWHKQLAPAGDTTCVFRDSAFSDDVTKTNLSAILNQHDLTNIRSL